MQIVSSDTVRTIESAKLLFPQKPIHIAPSLNEIDAGDVSNWRRITFDKRYPNFFKQFCPKRRFPGGESHLQMFRRQIRFIRALQQKYAESDLVVEVVCHAGTISSILHYYYKVPLKYYSRFETNNASLTVLSWANAAEPPKLVLFNAEAENI